jgi:hypothetical protein
VQIPDVILVLGRMADSSLQACWQKHMNVRSQNWAIFGDNGMRAAKNGAAGKADDLPFSGSSKGSKYSAHARPKITGFGSFQMQTRPRIPSCLGY